jgi:hypothetical protein
MGSWGVPLAREQMKGQGGRQTTTEDHSRTVSPALQLCTQGISVRTCRNMYVLMTSIRPLSVYGSKLCTMQSLHYAVSALCSLCTMQSLHYAVSAALHNLRASASLHHPQSGALAMPLPKHKAPRSMTRKSHFQYEYSVQISRYCSRLYCYFPPAALSPLLRKPPAAHLCLMLP